jgi:MoxR-like ATPase
LAGARGIESPEGLVDALAEVGYLADDRIATAVFLALALERPLLLEGDAGVGKTELALALSRLIGGELIRLQCYEGIDARQALYDWDYPRQLLHLRAVEATGAATDTDRLESELYGERFLVERPLLRALGSVDPEHPPVLLIDEIDRADDEFEAFLLELLSSFAVTIPELGTREAVVKPVVVLTSNRTRDLHDALKRRCLYLWVEHPALEREVAIIRSRVPDADAVLAEQVALVVRELRAADLYKPPGVAEAVDWASALARLSIERLDEESVLRTLGAVVKYREDEEKLRGQGVSALLKAALARGGG